MKNESKNNDNNSEGGGLREKMSALLELSGDAKVTFIGNREFIIENYKGITEYEDSKIRINAGKLDLCFCGRNMEIKTLTQELLYITGKVSSLTFENRG